MKKSFRILLFSSLLFAVSCESQKVVINRQVETASDGTMLLGYQTRSQLEKPAFADWYESGYAEYSLDQNAVAALKKEKLSTYNLTVVLGTWCEDSHREVPRLFKILDAVNFPESRLKLLAVNRKKEAPGGEEVALNIQRVPTVIVYKYGKEIGRIIESPETGYLERDLLQIIKK